MDERAEFAEWWEEHGLGDFGRQRDAWEAATQRQQERIAQLEAEVQALLLDAQRLDALEGTNVKSSMWIVARQKDSFTVALKSPYGNCVTRQTLRVAIDDAIAASKGATP